jgi:hypothetical protein
MLNKIKGTAKRIELQFVDPKTTEKGLNKETL